MLTPTTVFRKTALGSAEMSSRKLGLRSELRRLLILIDGRNTVSRLATFVRDPEIESHLLELQSLSLIDTGEGVVASPNMAAAPNAPSAAAPTAAQAQVDGSGLLPTQEQFLTARIAAVRHINDTLGPGGETLAVKLERTKSAQELREVVSQVRQSLERMMGEAAGQRFLEAVRSAVKL
jgi:hypothetical protein